jgi:regulator of replication initiation timing
MLNDSWEHHASKLEDNMMNPIVFTGLKRIDKPSIFDQLGDLTNTIQNEEKLLARVLELKKEVMESSSPIQTLQETISELKAKFNTLIDENNWILTTSTYKKMEV